MSEISVIFPHHLFKSNPALAKGRKVLLVEEFLFFRQYNFHKQKLVLHRASMKSYEAVLQKNGYEVTYIDAAEKNADVRKLIPYLKTKGISHIFFSDPSDNWLYKRIIDTCKKNDLQYTVFDSGLFLNTMQEANEYFDSRDNYFQTDFYIRERKKRKILLEPNNKPAGGRWSFDADNRKKFPAKEKPPEIIFKQENTFEKEAKAYVEKHFPDNYGSIDAFIYPTNFKAAEEWLQDFFKSRFEKFGVYEDAIVRKEHYLHHSVLSPLINTGLLLPKQIIDAAIKYAAENNIPLNSPEGFVRQIIGWREYIRIVYMREGSRQRTTGFWGFKRKIPKSFWEGTTGIDPIDDVIKKVLKTGYCHHIERLMVMGNFMLLCEFDPDEVYKWFMELFIDSYDWVMVPNVYGMVQFADGGLMVTKPYVSGSNYIIKMSDYRKGEWSGIWDALFWRFMIIHREVFDRNNRLNFLSRQIDKMDIDKKESYLALADQFLSKLDDEAN